uniref:Metalloendopeptidase n=1 Tax=Romanomermis culicivorax TaxID=13658 RepID=A0A915HNM2_ROMCU
MDFLNFLSILDCLQYGTIMHELNHALGRWHEQSRPDRDLYVKILWSNIVRDNANQFTKHPEESSDENELSLPYDYASILHYSPYAFSRNGLPTIAALKPGGNKMGQRDGMSPLDIEKLNRMYNCPEKKRLEEDEEEPKEKYNFTTDSSTTITPVGNEPENQECVDHTTQCPLYISLGGCDSPTVLKYCPKSCGACRSLFKIGTTTTTSRLIEKKIGQCQDKTPFSCFLWSSKGHCRTKSRFMARYCSKTCKICREEETIFERNSSFYCEDQYQSTCKHLAQSGLCGSYEFLSQKCPKSCGKCGLNTEIGTPRKLFLQKCDDKDENC